VSGSGSGICTETPVTVVGTGGYTTLEEVVVVVVGVDGVGRTHGVVGVLLPHPMAPHPLTTTPTEGGGVHSTLPPPPPPPPPCRTVMTPTTEVLVLLVVVVVALQALAPHPTLTVVAVGGRIMGGCTVGRMAPLPPPLLSAVGRQGGGWVWVGGGRM
jgi:hypothetical protein